MSKFAAGKEFCVAYPFVRTTYEAFPDDLEGSPVTTPTWRPGVENENVPPYGATYSFANGMGSVIYSVVAVFKPGKFPERIFFTRKWVDPDGKKFGKGNLHVTTTQNFRNMLAGWRHEFEIEEA